MCRAYKAPSRLIKTARGKYFTPVPIENSLSSHPMVEMANVSGVGLAEILPRDVIPAEADLAGLSDRQGSAIHRVKALGLLVRQASARRVNAPDVVLGQQHRLR